MKIYIFSRLQIQRELLSRYLNNQDIIQCESAHFYSVSNIMIKEQDPKSFWQQAVILWDAGSNNSEQLWSFIHTHMNHGNGTYPIVLFNVQHESTLEKEALDVGFLGVFYQEDGIGTLMKGLSAIMQGQLWFSRWTLQQYLIDIRTNGVHYLPRQGRDNGLTHREKELLRLMKSGVNNQDIADRLCISPHTVKSHITNIYRKINVENRYQAILWVHQNSKICHDMDMMGHNQPPAW